jgi:hypothetical protein
MHACVTQTRGNHDRRCGDEDEDGTEGVESVEPSACALCVYEKKDNALPKSFAVVKTRAQPLNTRLGVDVCQGHSAMSMAL